MNVTVKNLKRISLGIIIEWLSKFPARKNYTQAIFFQACLYRAHHAVIFAIAQLFTARCTLVQSAVLPSYVVRLSVRPSVRPSVRL